MLCPYGKDTMPTDLIAGLIVGAEFLGGSCASDQLNGSGVGTPSQKVNPKKSVGIAMQTAFQDFLPKDKQQAMEIVMEQKDQKKMEVQESREGRRHERTRS